MKPEVFICGDTHKRRTSTDRVILNDRQIVSVVREPGKDPQVRRSELSKAQYGQVASAFTDAAFFALPSQIPSEEVCGDTFWLMAAAPHVRHRSDNDSTESASYQQIFNTCVRESAQPDLTWHRSSLPEVANLIAERVKTFPPEDARAALLQEWLEHLMRNVQR